MIIEINWTQEKKDAVCAKIEKWIREYDATAGESIMQSDKFIISAPEMLSDIVDDIIKPKRIYSDED
jgi:hypothetical protein